MAEGSSPGIDAIYQFVSAGFQLFSGVAFYMVIVRLFNTSIVGAIALFLAIIGLFNIVFSFGLATAIQHFSSYHLARGDYATTASVLKRLLLYSTILALLGALTIVAGSGPISSLFLHTGAYTALVRLLGLVLLGNIIYGVLNGALLGLRRFRLAAVISIITWVFYYFGSVGLAILTRSFSTIVYGWMMGTFVGAALGLVALGRTVNGFGHNIDPGSSGGIRYDAGGGLAMSRNGGAGPSARTIIYYTVPVLLSGVIGYGATYVDRFVVAGLMSLSSLGVYNFALLVVGGTGFIATPFVNILITKFSSLFGAGLRSSIRDLMKTSTLLLSAIYVPVALVIAALAPIILALLGGGRYVGGSVALAVIMFFSALAVSGNMLMAALASTRRTRVFIYSSAAALASNLAFSLLLIPRLGLLGAAIGYSSANVGSFAVLWAFLNREGLLSYDARGMLKVWASSMGAFLILMLLERWVGYSIPLLFPYLIIGAAFYLVALKALRTFSKERKGFILSLFPASYGWLRWIIDVLL